MKLFFFYFQVTKLINDNETTQVFDDIFSDNVKIFEFFTKTKFQTMQNLIINQILYVFNFDVFDRKKIDGFLQFIFNF